MYTIPYATIEAVALFVSRQYQAGYRIVVDNEDLELPAGLAYMKQEQIRTGMAIPPVLFEFNYNRVDVPCPSAKSASSR